MSRPHHPVVELTRARLLEYVREPEIIFWVFVFPVLMTVALGIAFRSPADARVPVRVVAGDGAAAMTAVLEATREFRVSTSPMAGAMAALRDGDVHLVVEPSDPPVYHFDPTRPETRVARLAVDQALQQAAGRVDRWRAAERRVVTPGSRYVDWLVPGLLGMNIMSTGLWGIGFSVVYARMQKLLKRLMATPMRRWQYLLAQMVARLLFLGVEVVTLVGFATLAFGVPMLGSWLDLAAACLVGALCFAGIGLLVASRANTIEAVSGLLNVVMLPMWLTSGVFFSSKNFPDVSQPFINALPLTALNQLLRGVMLEGQSLAAFGVQLAVLAAWGAVSFFVALRIFRWR